MLTFKEVYEGLFASLSTAFPTPAYYVAKGKYTSLPQLLPAVDFYMEPAPAKYTSDGKPFQRYALIQIFCLYNGKEASDNVLDSLQLAEMVEKQVYTYLDTTQNNYVPVTDRQPVKFDAIYDDVAVAYFECLVYYKQYEA